MWAVLAGWTWPSKGLLLVGCWLLVLGLGHGLYLRGGDAALARATARGVELQAQWQQQADLAGRLAGQQAQLLQLQQRLEAAQAPLLPENGLPTLLQEIAAAGRGLVFEQINVQAAQARAEYAHLPIQVRVVGSFSRLSAFVEALAALSTKVTLHDLEVVPLEGREPLRLNLQLRAYASGVPADVPAPLAEAAQGAARDPFSASATEPAGFVLERLALEQLELVGHLADGRGVVALIRAAGVLYPVREGDRLGPDQGTVVRISAQQVELAERVWVEGGGWVGRSRLIAINPQ